MVVVLAASYEYTGTKGTQMLAEGLPEDWRLIAIDRNSYVSCYHNLGSKRSFT